MSENLRVPGMRPRKATCGREARRRSCTSEMIAPMRTPRNRPDPSTPSNAAIATTNSARSARHTKQFLVGVETIAVLDGEHAAKSRRLHHAEKKTTQREGQQVVEVGHMN